MTISLSCFFRIFFHFDKKMHNCRLSVFLAVLVCSACGDASQNIKERELAAQSKKPTESSVKPDGMAIFRKNCVVCHGADGKLGLNGAKDLTLSERPKGERIEIITNGKNLMTPFGKILTADEIEAVTDYTLSLKK
jgi:cytochrome c6